jgi:fructose-bisphosphate aldolase, class I
MNALQTTAAELVADGKGILAADESNRTMARRMEAVGARSTPQTRLRFRELLVTTPGAAHAISGVILYEETLRQRASDATEFPRLLEQHGMLAGIKVDTGAKPLAGADGETVTEGLDGLRERLAAYRDLGARFAKWRAVLSIGPGTPSRYCMAVNAHALARYAALCQEAGLVPVVEPEVLMYGDHPIDVSEQATEETLRAVITELLVQHVRLEAIVLKPNMVLAGYDCTRQPGVEEVAHRTLAVLRRTVPAAVPGIAFLSGGQSDDLACAHLSAMNAAGEAPWQLSFSYGRALQAAALGVWAGQEENAERARAVFEERVRCATAARRGEYQLAVMA